MSPGRIERIFAREVLDSRGNPTVEAEVQVGSHQGRASVPSGASKGRLEALELRDGDSRRFHGKGVLKAAANVNRTIGPMLIGADPVDIRSIDQAMLKLDGTPNKSKLGANAILSVSMATARAASSLQGKPLFSFLKESKTYTMPVPMMNVINGGEHAGNDLAIQEFLIEPVGVPTCTDAIRAGSEVYHSLKEVLVEAYGRGAINVGDEGGFAPPLSKTKEALEAVRKAVTRAGYAEDDVRLGIDAASSTFYDKEKDAYSIDGRSLKPDAMEDYYSELRDEFGLLTIEDPFSEDAFGSFSSITRRLGRKTAIIGDDLYATNVGRIKEGLRTKATNAVLIKLNQIGTVSETEDAISLAQKSGWEVAVSHRSGETEDPFIAHLATAFGATFIKTGAPARGERLAKYNELLRIQEGLGSKARFAGKQFS